MQHIISSYYTPMKYDSLLIYGKGGHSKVVSETAHLLGWSPVFIDDTDFENFSFSKSKIINFIVAIGDNRIRENRAEKLLSLGLTPVTIIHPRAFCSSQASLGKGIYVGPQASICSGAVIEDHCIVNTNASVDHDVCIARATHIAPGVNICGNVAIGARCLIGVGSSIIPNVIIGCDVIVAGGSSVKENIPSYTTVAGNPAKTKKQHML